MSEHEGGSKALGACLFVIGALGLAANVYIGSRFGWSLAQDPVDRSVIAVIHGVASAAEAVLTAAGAFMWAWGKGWRFRSVLAVSVAAIFTAYGFLSAYGFFSNRIAVSSAQQAVVKTDQSFLDWLKGQTVNTDIARAERKTMLAEAKAANEGLKKTLGTVKDQQANAVAALFGQEPERAQRWLVASTAAIAYLVQFSGFWFGATTWARRRKRETDRKVSGSPEDPDGEVKVSDKPKEKQPETVPRQAEIVPLRKAAAPVAPSPDRKAMTVSEYLARHAGVTHTSQAAISAGTGLSPATVSRHLKKLEGRGKVKRSRHKRAKAVTYGGQSLAFGR